MCKDDGLLMYITGQIDLMEDKQGDGTDDQCCDLAPPCAISLPTALATPAMVTGLEGNRLDIPSTNLKTKQVHRSLKAEAGAVVQALILGVRVGGALGNPRELSHLSKTDANARNACECA